MTERDAGVSAEGLERALGDLRALSGEMDSCAVLSSEGALIGSSHAEGVDRERVAAMVSALMSLAGRTARASGREQAAQLRITTDLGHLLLVRLEGGGALVAATAPEARAGLVLYDMKNSRSAVERAMGEGEA